MRGTSDKRKRRLTFGLVVAGLFAAPAAEAQQIISDEIIVDRARLSGFVLRGELQGTIDNPLIRSFEGFEDGVDVRDRLGLDSGRNGWFVAADLGASRRHRFLVSMVGLEHSRVFDVAIPFDPLPPLELVFDSRVSLRDVHAGYNFLFTETDWIDAGAIVGVGHFRNEVATSSELFTVSEELSSAYGLVGANLLLHAEDIMSIYTELTGFPSVSVGDLSGSQMQFQVQFLVYPIPNVGVSAGYLRYELSLDDAASGVALDFTWDGFLLGGQYRF